MPRKQNTTSTISNRDWNSLVRRARKANPELDDFTAPRAVRRRRQASQQRRNASWS